MQRIKKITAIILSVLTLSSVCVFGSSFSAGAKGTGAGLAEWALNAYNSGWSYVYGGSTPGAVDCSGLIYSYAGGERCGNPQLETATETGSVSAGIPNVHGLGLWRPGHVGVYVGNGMEVDARGDEYGVCYEAMALMFYQWGLFSLPWWTLLVTLIVCTGIINAYNFMDGINGITGGYSLVILVSLAYVNAEVISFTEQSFIYTMICSVLVFDFFNFRKRAKCFAGDVGSVSIAFVVLFLIGSLILQTKDFSWLVLLVVYGVDSVLTIVHRLLLHENIGLPHRKHLYQIMANELKIPHVAVALTYMSVQTVVLVGYLLLREYGYGYLLGSILVLGLLYFLFMKRFFYLHKSN